MSAECMFPLCRCYVRSNNETTSGEIVVYKTHQGAYIPLARTCELEDCKYPNCQDGTCEQIFPPDYFASCKKRK